MRQPFDICETVSLCFISAVQPKHLTAPVLHLKFRCKEQEAKPARGFLWQNRNFCRRGVGVPRPLFNFGYFEITGIKFLSVIRAGYRLMTAGTLAVGLNFRRAVQFGPADVVNG